MTQFKAKIVYKNPSAYVQSGKGIKIKIPHNISAREPEFVSSQTLQEANSEGLSIIAGKAVFEFYTIYEPDEWKKVTSAGKSNLWQFRSDIYTFYMSVSILVQEGFKRYPKTVAVIMEHEFLHVSDDVDLMENFLPKAIENDWMVKDWLIDKKPINERSFSHYFRENNFQAWIQDGYWTPEHNKRAQARDSGAEWSRYRQRIDELQRG